MFTISVETRFTAQHRIILPGGCEEKLHEHDWVVIARVSAEKLNDTKLVMDFGLLQRMVNKIVGGFEGQLLNEFDYFRRNGCSTEMVARYVFEQLEPRLSERVKLEEVRVFEEPGCYAGYRK